MATKNKNLSNYDTDGVPDGTNMRIGIVVAEWNSHITFSLLDGACSTLEKHGVKEENIFIEEVPGAFELIFGAKMLAETLELDAIIGLGCVIRGETPHFEYICQGVTQGFAELNVRYPIPFIFGVLTDNDEQQSMDRSGGVLGNKGDEAAVTAIKMAHLCCKLKK